MLVQCDEGEMMLILTTLLCCLATPALSPLSLDLPSPPALFRLLLSFRRLLQVMSTAPQVIVVGGGLSGLSGSSAGLPVHARPSIHAWRSILTDVTNPNSIPLLGSAQPLIRCTRYVVDLCDEQTVC